MLTVVYSAQSQPSTPTRDRFQQGPPRPSHITTPSPLGGPSITPTTPVSNHRRSHSAQSPPSEGRSYPGGARDHRRTGSSSADISINIEPPVRGFDTFLASRVSVQLLNGTHCSLDLVPTSRPVRARSTMVCYRHRAPVSPCPTRLPSLRPPYTPTHTTEAALPPAATATVSPTLHLHSNMLCPLPLRPVLPLLRGGLPSRCRHTRHTQHLARVHRAVLVDP